jgi:thiol:disulfide interchange protein
MIRIVQRGAVRLLGFAALASLLGLATFAFAQGKKSDSVVKVTASADKPDADGKQVITISLAMDPDWHVYANPVGNEMSVDSQTTVEVKSATPPDVLKIEYPQGKLVKDDKFGDYKIYEEKAAIKVLVRRKGNSPLELAVKFQSCNDKKKQCLQPATVKLNVP